MKGKIIAFGNLIVEAVLFANVILTSMGKNPIPFDEELAYQIVSDIALLVVSIYVWYKNQNITVEAQTAQKILDDMKKDKDTPDGTGDPKEGDE